MSAIVIDLLIAAIVALSVYLGWKKGMVRSLLALAATILAILAASQIADIVTDLAIEKLIRPAAKTAIEDYLQDMAHDIVLDSPVKDLENVIDAIENDLVREKAREMLASMEISNDTIVITTKDDLAGVSKQIVDTVLNGVVRDIISAIISILCFALLSLALRPVIWVIEQAFRLPLLRQVNQFGGLVSGAVKGIVLVFIAVWAFRMAQLYVTDEVVSRSFLLKIVVDCLNSLGFGSTVIL